MAYIPEQHKKYNILPISRKSGREVFSYPGKIIDNLENYLPDEEDMIPYGYDSYEQYMKKMDGLATRFFNDEKIRKIYEQFKVIMKETNVKEDWSVLRYIGKSDDRLFGLTHGNIYYWPCSKKNPVYEGVIDDEEFTSYWYSTEAEDWEILEDPTGMAYATIYEMKKGYTSQKQYIDAMKQLEKLMQV